MTAYTELAPIRSLFAYIRTVWIHRVGHRPYLQRNLPTGGVELHCPIGGRPRLIGPLTGPLLQILPPQSTVVGARFWPGAAARLFDLPANELVDVSVGLEELWGGRADLLAERLVDAGDPESALILLQQHLSARVRWSAGADPLVGEAARKLMPWRPIGIDRLSDELSISASQLRRRVTSGVGVAPKVLQRTLRFQGYLALTQAAAGSPEQERIADLAAAAGYADHAHLTRECLRLTGITPTELLRGAKDRCCCGHDHQASYRPFLAGRVTQTEPA